MVTLDGRRWPAGLHNTPARFGKLVEYDRFDASFFSVHGKQAQVGRPVALPVQDQAQVGHPVQAAAQLQRCWQHAEGGWTTSVQNTWNKECSCASCLMRHVRPGCTRKLSCDAAGQRACMDDLQTWSAAVAAAAACI